jgi:hypothetical protein
MPLHLATPSPGDDADPDAQLAHFDLSVALLQERVISPAQAAARMVSPLAPRGYAGQTRHAVAVSALRELLLPLGWERNDDENVARVRHVERGLAIVVATGNALTGLPFSTTGRQPSTKWPKGDLTRAAAADNEQLTLFDPANVGDDAERTTRPPFETWLLLLRAVQSEVRAELSRPVGVNPSGYIDRWGHRIVVPPVANDGTAADPDLDDEGDIPDVPIAPL